MARGYAKDLRERAVAMVEEGENRREIARRLKLAPPPGRYSLLFNHLLTKP
jgi:transposase-like protein